MNVNEFNRTILECKLLNTTVKVVKNTDLIELY